MGHKDENSKFMKKLSWLSRKFSKQTHSWFIKTLLMGMVAGGGIFGLGMPAFAADILIVKLGPFQHQVPVEDIERYAESGEVSESLKPFAYLLTPDVKSALSERLEVNREEADKKLQELFNSPSGERIEQAVKLALPGTSLEQLQGAVLLAAEMVNQVSVPSVLRALPMESITLDASALVTVISKINLPDLNLNQE
jgi:hypothetical protein